MDELKNQLPKNHVIYTMYVEHDEILGLLKELDALNQVIQGMTEYNESSDFTRLLSIANSILDAENHHLREENVLFKELEAKGLVGPTEVMRSEHDDLRSKKKKLKELAENVKNIDFNDFKQGVNEIAQYIVVTLTNHIAKENNVLYPASLRFIQDKSQWDEMKERCDEIGYCGFTPKIED